MSFYIIDTECNSFKIKSSTVAHEMTIRQMRGEKKNNNRRNQILRHTMLPLESSGMLFRWTFVFTRLIYFDNEWLYFHCLRWLNEHHVIYCCCSKCTRSTPSKSKFRNNAHNHFLVCVLVEWLTGDIARSLSADDTIVDRCRQCKRARRCVITKLNSFSLDANRKSHFNH